MNKNPNKENNDIKIILRIASGSTYNFKFYMVFGLVNMNMIQRLF